MSWLPGKRMSSSMAAVPDRGGVVSLPTQQPLHCMAFPRGMRCGSEEALPLPDHPGMTRLCAVLCGKEVSGPAHPACCPRTQIKSCAQSHNLLPRMSKTACYREREHVVL